MQDLDYEEKFMLAWKAGKCMTQPWPGVLRGLREKGYMTEGNILNCRLTDKGEKAVQELFVEN
ncbi:MAG: hypothetical protein AAF986_05570 [Pseudomonadota bacterium]